MLETQLRTGAKLNSKVYDPHEATSSRLRGIDICLIHKNKPRVKQNEIIFQMKEKMLQIIEKEEIPEKHLNDRLISNLPDQKFKVMVTKMTTKQENNG